MPRHPISDAHEWIREIPTVPIYCLAKPQPRERAWKNRRGKKTLLSLTLVCCAGRLERCRISGRVTASEIPLLMMLFYLFRYVEPVQPNTLYGSGVKPRFFFVGYLRGRHRQVGSLAGAAHLLNDNTGVLRGAQ